MNWIIMLIISGKTKSQNTIHYVKCEIQARGCDCKQWSPRAWYLALHLARNFYCSDRVITSVHTSISTDNRLEQSILQSMSNWIAENCSIKCLFFASKWWEKWMYSFLSSYSVYFIHYLPSIKRPSPHCMKSLITRRAKWTDLTDLDKMKIFQSTIEFFAAMGITAQSRPFNIRNLLTFLVITIMLVMVDVHRIDLHQLNHIYGSFIAFSFIIWKKENIFQFIDFWEKLAETSKYISWQLFSHLVQL